LPIRRGHARVLFNEGAFAEDTMQSVRAGAEALRDARNQFERDGVEIKTLRRCDPEGRDGTELPACFKVYLPAPNGKFGMVFRFVRDADGIALRYLALGVRHHPRNSHAQIVYEVAHRRLPGWPARQFGSLGNLVPKLVPDSTELSTDLDGGRTAGVSHLLTQVSLLS